MRLLYSNLGCHMVTIENKGGEGASGCYIATFRSHIVTTENKRLSFLAAIGCVGQCRFFHEVPHADSGRGFTAPASAAGEAQAFRQVRPENPVFGDQILVLEQQFLIHQASNIRQKDEPICYRSSRATIFAEPSKQMGSGSFSIRGGPPHGLICPAINLFAEERYEGRFCKIGAVIIALMDF